MFSISAKTKRLDFLVLQINAPKKSERFLVKGAICYSAPVVGATALALRQQERIYFSLQYGAVEGARSVFGSISELYYGALLLIAPFPKRSWSAPLRLRSRSAPGALLKWSDLKERSVIQLRNGAEKGARSKIAPLLEPLRSRSL